SYCTTTASLMGPFYSVALLILIRREKKGRACPGLRGKPAQAGKLRLHAHREKTCKKNNSLSRERKTSVK
ncbi:hypothetical protein, partial [Faecalispora jeddahensis]|uniref:hypothetical protein n=1 Tax=Faecalispora jeddahensis TaxID=1414721 RepID=UPI0019D68E30